jgi:hypothetical protein
VHMRVMGGTVVVIHQSSTAGAVGSSGWIQ